jgi:GT2 family glycosyltransferase
MKESDVLKFYGSESMVLSGPFTTLRDSFTYEFWLKAEQPIRVHREAWGGIAGLYGQRYIVGPEYTKRGDKAAIGISAGNNGICVYEHADNHMVAVLVFKANLSDWTHVAVVYNEKTPHLYLNGRWVRTGMTSGRASIFASNLIGGHPFGHFAGCVKELRIWRRARSEEQIRTMMNTKLSSMKDGLYWYWDADRGVAVCCGKKREIDVSVVIPSHNRFPLNWLGLHTLARQTFPASRMEVLFIDDASADATPAILNQFNPPFLMKRIRAESNLGRSKTRNIGIRASAGRHILFMDAEMLAHPQLIENHYRHHLLDERTIVSACMDLKRLYTVLFPEFAEYQIEQARELYRDDPTATQLIHDFAHSDRSLTQLIPTEEVCCPDLLERRSYRSPLADSFTDILKTYGNQFTGFHFPWLNFLTGNVSVSRKLLTEAGLFDEQFSGHGLEDWELGYRLYLRGAKFIHDPAAVTYHQDHPLPPNIADHNRFNYHRFQAKFPHFEVLLLALRFIPPQRSFNDLNGYTEDYRALCNEHADRYMRVKSTISDMLMCAANLYSQGHQMASLQTVDDHELIQELTELRESGMYSKVVALYDYLTSL